MSIISVFYSSEQRARRTGQHVHLAADTSVKSPTTRCAANLRSRQSTVGALGYRGQGENIFLKIKPFTKKRPMGFGSYGRFFYIEKFLKFFVQTPTSGITHTG